MSRPTREPGDRLSPDAGERLAAFPVYVGRLDGIAVIPATGELLVFGYDGAAEVVTTAGEPLIPVGPTLAATTRMVLSRHRRGVPAGAGQ